MTQSLDRLMSLEVPIIVRMGERLMTLGDVLSMVPGMIIELPKHAEEELDLLVNNKVVGSGRAVKVGENYGIRISFVGDVRSRLSALGPCGEASPQAAPGAAPDGAPAGDSGGADAELAALAEKMLAGQM